MFQSNISKNSDLTRRASATIVLMVILMGLLMAMVAFCVEVSRMSLLHTEIQSAVDAGAIACSLQLREDPDNFERAEEVAREFIQKNRVGSTRIVDVDTITVELGKWEPDNRSFTVSSDDPEAVRILAKQNERFIFGRLLGSSTFFTAPASAIVASHTGQLDVMMVLDLSGSMKSSGRIEALTRILHRSI